MGGGESGEKDFLGGHSKCFMGKGGEEIAGWTLRVSNYFYCPHSPSFYAQSGVLGSSKKCSPCPSSPQGDVQVSVTLWGKTCCQQYYAMTVMMHHNPPPTHTCWHGSRLPPATGSTCPLGACRCVYLRVCVCRGCL